MVKVFIKKNGVIIKEIIVTTHRAINTINSYRNIAGDLWNGEDIFEVGSVELKKITSQFAIK